MATRKAALVNCRQGPWISTTRMRNLSICVKAAAGVVLRVVQRTPDNSELSYRIEGEGEHKLADHPWTRVEVAEGSEETALCFLVAS